MKTENGIRLNDHQLYEIMTRRSIRASYKPGKTKSQRVCACAGKAFVLLCWIGGCVILYAFVLGL